MSIAGSLLYAFGSLLHPRMLWLMLWPVLISLAIWGAVALALWMRIAMRLAGLLEKWIETAVFFVQFDAADVAILAAHLLLFLAWVPLVYLTVLLILGVFAMQAMVEHVARRSFADLERRHAGSFAGSLGNALAALAGLVVLGAITLPFWAFPLLWPAIPVAVMGWVNQKLLRYDALAEHAGTGEMKRIFRERRGALYLLGALLAVVAYVPLLGLFAPMLFGIAFIHYLLGALRERRSAPGDVSPA